MSVPGPQDSLLVACLDLGRAMADRDSVTFRSQGTCMYPTIRPGDILRIRSCAAREVTLGDIAVCRELGRLFSHRVVEVGDCGGCHYVTTRPDRSAQDDGITTYDDDLLGVVVSIERNGTNVPLQPTELSWVARSINGLRIAIIEARRHVRGLLLSVVLRMQRTPGYQYLACAWLERTKHRLRFVARVPVNSTLGYAACREFGTEQVDSDFVRSSRSGGSFVLAALHERENTLEGSVTAKLDSSGVWRLSDTWVRVRYERTGLDEMLREKARAIVEGGVGHGANRWDETGE